MKFSESLVGGRRCGLLRNPLRQTRFFAIDGVFLHYTLPLGVIQLRVGTPEKFRHLIRLGLLEFADRCVNLRFHNPVPKTAVDILTHPLLIRFMLWQRTDLPFNGSKNLNN